MVTISLDPSRTLSCRVAGWCLRRSFGDMPACSGPWVTHMPVPGCTAS